jgi:hypothetical protein
MSVVLWVIAGLVAAAVLVTGPTTVARLKEKLAAAGMAWTDDFSPGVIKTIGTPEILAAIGLILPAVLKIAPYWYRWPPSASSSS